MYRFLICKMSACLSDTIPCPAGFYRNRSQCAPCPMGTYQPQSSANEGMSACKPCDSGKYCMYPKASGVTGYCQKGYYCPVRSTMPTSRLCPEDHYCPGGSSIPTKCDNGATSRRGSGSSSDCIGGTCIILFLKFCGFVVTHNENKSLISLLLGHTVRIKTEYTCIHVRYS